MSTITVPSILAEAIELAASAHLNQVDKSGEPYILHPLRVMFKLREQGYSEIVQAAGVLHDVLEDTATEYWDVECIHPEVYRLVALVTRKEWEETLGNGEPTVRKEEYAKFIHRASVDPFSRAIKEADIRDNLSRLEKLTPANAEFLATRYAKALTIIEGYK